MINNENMKHLILLSLIFISLPAFAYPPENEADFLYSHGDYNTPMIINYSNGHTYTKGVNDTYVRDDGVEFRKDYNGVVETSSGKTYIPIPTNKTNKNDYYLP